MDENAGIKYAIGSDVGVIIFLNKFIAKPTDRKQFLKLFEKTTKYMKKRLNIISSRLREYISGSYAFFNYGTWESTDYLK